MIIIHNVETNEITERDATAEEIFQADLDAAAALAEAEAKTAKEAARQELLNRLGITAEEAGLLLG